MPVVVTIATISPVQIPHQAFCRLVPSATKQQHRLVLVTGPGLVDVPLTSKFPLLLCIRRQMLCLGCHTASTLGMSRLTCRGRITASQESWIHQPLTAWQHIHYYLPSLQTRHRLPTLRAWQSAPLVIQQQPMLLHTLYKLQTRRVSCSQTVPAPLSRPHRLPTPSKQEYQRQAVALCPAKSHLETPQWRLPLHWLHWHQGRSGLTWPWPWRQPGCPKVSRLWGGAGSGGPSMNSVGAATWRCRQCRGQLQCTASL